jgi:putative chitinase
MDLALAIRSTVGNAPNTAIDGLKSIEDDVKDLGALSSELRTAHLIGQCAHESGGFTRLVESLFYSSGARIFAVFGRRHFDSIADANQFARNQQKLANRVYANRMGNGNTASGDGFRYRGRGYLQLTGRSNYRVFGGRIGIDLVADPERTEEPATAWLVAASYLASRSRAGKTALEWADEDNVEMVTRIVNGGTNGLHDRRTLTARALSALGGMARRPALRKGAEGAGVLQLQQRLSERGFLPRAIDGDFGPKTEKALKAFQADAGIGITGRADEATWEALEAGSGESGAS